MSKQTKVAIVNLLFILGLSSLAFAADETLTITTYYPSPYGSYTNMWVANRLGVGSGTSTPAATLDVGTTTSCCGGGNPTIGLSEATNTNSRLPWLQFHSAGYSEAFMRLSTDRVFEIGNSQNTTTQLALMSAAASVRNIVFNPTGVSYFNSGSGVGINVTSPAVDLHVNGRIRSNSWAADGSVVAYKSAAGDLGVAPSDRRLKKNITPLANALDTVKKLSGIKYNGINDKEGEQKKLGLIAQDVMQVIPEAAFSYKNDKGQTYYGVHYDKIPVILIEAVKEQEKKIDKQQEEIEDLRNQIAKIKKAQEK